MGWTYGWKDKRDLVGYLNCRLNTSPHKVLKHSVRSNLLWQLVEINPREGDTFKPYITIWVNKLAKQEGVWGYKDMDISCGPFYSGCPKSYLLAVTCPDERAKQWVKDQLNPKELHVGNLFNHRGQVYQVEVVHLGIRGSQSQVVACSTTNPNQRYRFTRDEVLINLLADQEQPNVES